jgi:hypothetical protein
MLKKRADRSNLTQDFPRGSALRTGRICLQVVTAMIAFFVEGLGVI